ncbi:hypothetical protein ACOSQ3_005117 [Xanthoceras sorbifolium]
MLLPDDLVIPWCHTYLSDSYAFCSNPPQLKPLCLVHWIPPDVSCYKINIDAAIDTKIFAIGLGVVVRNCHGQILLSSSYPVEGDFDPKIV